MAFMLEASFLGIMVFGWKRVSPKCTFSPRPWSRSGRPFQHSGSWLQTPGCTPRQEDILRTEIHNHQSYRCHLQPGHVLGCVAHVGGVPGDFAICYWGLSLVHPEEKGHRIFPHLIQNCRGLRNLDSASANLVGDGSGISVYQYQPAKLAAMEAHWETNPPGEAAPWLLAAWPDVEKERNAWQIAIPYGLSLISTRSLTGQVQGLRDVPKPDRPPVALNF